MLKTEGLQFGIKKGTVSRDYCSEFVKSEETELNSSVKAATTQTGRNEVNSSIKASVNTKINEETR